MLPQWISYSTQHLMHDTKGHRRNQGYSALHYQQKQFENAAQEHQGVAFEEVQSPANNHWRRNSNSVALRLNFAFAKFGGAESETRDAEDLQNFEGRQNFFCPWQSSAIGRAWPTNPQLGSSRIGDGAYSISVGRRQKCYEMLESRWGSNRCRIKRYHSSDGHTHRWKYSSVSSAKSFRRERSFLFSIWLSSPNTCGRPYAKRSTQWMIQTARSLRETISITTRPRKDDQQEQNYLPSNQLGAEPCKK